MYVLGVDPGKTTGFAVLRRTDFEVETNKWGIAVVVAGDISWEGRFDELMPYLEACRKHGGWVVYEQYRLRPTYTAVQDKTVPAVEATGVLLAQLNAIAFPEERIISQPAANRKSVRVLKGHGEFMTSEHSRDAYRHARYFIVVRSNNEVQAAKAARLFMEQKDRDNGNKGT